MKKAFALAATLVAAVTLAACSGGTKYDCTKINPSTKAAEKTTCYN